MKYIISLFCFLKLLIFCLIMGRGASVQLIPNERLDAYKKSQFFKTVTVQARRGSVYDRKQKELAISTPTYSLFADPEFVRSPRYAARKIAKHLGLNARVLEKKMRKKTRFVWLKRRLPLDLKKEIESLGVSGLYFVGESHRTYPEETSLSQTLGFVGSEGQGLEGLEYSYNEHLEGKDVTFRVSRDAKGRPITMNPEQYTQPPEGDDLVLSVDSEFQRYLELELQKVYKKQKAKRAVGLILDVESGGIRAAAVWPSYNLNQARKVQRKLRKNILFQEALEQGSTIKPFSVAAALEDGAYTPRSKFDCLDGKIKIGRRVIRDTSDHECEQMTLTQGLAVSSNVVFTQMAQGLEKNTLRDFYKKVGFGQKTNVDFPGESAGILRDKAWPGHLNISASFGHGFTATPLQVAAAYNAIANNGIWKQPYLVEEMIQPNGLNVKIKREQKRVMSEQTAWQTKMMLTEVTQGEGTGVAAQVNGYLVAGKTGTAHKVDLENGGYYKDKYYTSFVGMVPAGQPRFIIYIGVDEPEEDHYASKVAAPVFSRVARFILNKERVQPEVILAENKLGCQNENCKGDMLLEKLSSSENLNKKINKTSQTDAQASANELSPTKSTAINELDKKEQEALANLAKSPAHKLPISKSSKPAAIDVKSLKGLTLRDALRILRSSQADFDVRGHGIVSRIQFLKGKELNPDAKVRIHLNAN